jgi:hypothetical protein
MPDYIKSNSKSYNNLKNNSKNCNNQQYFSCHRFQSYDAATLGQNVKICTPNSCRLQLKCAKSNCQFNNYVYAQQNLYAKMRRQPELFPIISWVNGMNLTPAQQRAYSNMWYRQFGTSQAMPVNDNWGGFYVVGSEVPYTN